MSDLLPAAYPELLEELKGRIRTAQLRAHIAVNQELVLLYWHIGRSIAAREAGAPWGAQVIKRLSQDLRAAFPDTRGYSVRNLLYMRQFASAWASVEFAQQAVARIPWGHNIVLLEKLEAPDVRLWYATKAVEHGWSRSVLTAQIETRLHDRQGQALTNFDARLPADKSELAKALLKDPYSFAFLGLEEDVRERDLERAMLAHVRRFLLELGTGFALVGSQYKLTVGEDDFYVDLLFYHVKLHVYVAVELKTEKFQPAHTGQLNFYLTAIDRQVRDPKVDGPTIGLLLCKSKNDLVVEYCLQGTAAPMGVSAYRLGQALPDEVSAALPSVATLEQELEVALDDEVEPDT